MPIQEGKYVTPAWQNGGPPAIDAAELTAIGNSIVTNQNNILTNTQNIQTNQQDIETLQSTVQNINSNYLNKTGGTMSGQLDMGNNKIINLGTPSSNTDAATKGYADSLNTFNWSLIYSQSIYLSAQSTTKNIDINTPSSITSISSKYVQIVIVIRGSWSLTKSGTSVMGPTFTFNQIDLLDLAVTTGKEGQITACVAFPYKLRDIDQDNSVDITRFWAYTSSSGNRYIPWSETSKIDRILLSATSSYSQTFNGTIYYYGLS